MTDMTGSMTWFPRFQRGNPMLIKRWFASANRDCPWLTGPMWGWLVLSALRVKPWQNRMEQEKNQHSATFQTDSRNSLPIPNEPKGAIWTSSNGSEETITVARLNLEQERPQSIPHSQSSIHRAHGWTCTLLLNFLLSIPVLNQNLSISRCHCGDLCQGNNTCFKIIEAVTVHGSPCDTQVPVGNAATDPSTSASSQ